MAVVSSYFGVPLRDRLGPPPARSIVRWVGTIPRSSEVKKLERVVRSLMTTGALASRAGMGCIVAGARLRLLPTAQRVPRVASSILVHPGAEVPLATVAMIDETAGRQ